MTYHDEAEEFEFELSHANEVEMEERSQSVLEVMDLDGGLIGIEDTMDDYWEEEYHFIEKLNHYVWKWAKQIRLNKAYPRKTCFIQNTTEDYFLTFNYTSVLERVYQISSDKICHIHGGLTPYCKEKPILGHGNVNIIDVYQEKAKRSDDEFDEGSKSIYNAIAKFYERIFKDTPVYNFLIKNAVQDFLLYNEFDQNITKDSDPVRQTYYTMKKL